MKYQLSEIARIAGGRLSGRDREVTGVVFDSRGEFFAPGSLFIALRGERIDGTQFVREMTGKGVTAFLVPEGYPAAEEQPEAGYVRVPDTLAALQRLAADWRSRLTMPVVAVTGSNGKTVVKEWIAQLWDRDSRIFRSPKSYNSQLGVALSLLMCDPKDRIAVIEAGISKKGEMARLQRMIRPDIGIITTIGEAHQENFASLEEKLEEKLTLMEGCRHIIYCGDKPMIRRAVEARFAPQQRFCWGHGDNDNLRLLSVETERTRSRIRFAYEGKTYEAAIPMSDTASQENIMTVLAFYALTGADLEAKCRESADLQGVEMRLELKNGINNCKIINDSYNSDFNSLTLALDYLNALAKEEKKAVILSDILQSGQNKETLYRNVSELLHAKRIDLLIAVGEDISRWIRPEEGMEIRKFATTQAFADYLHEHKSEFREMSILLKGSRRFAFERLSLLLEEKQHATILEVNLDNLIDNLNYYKSLTRKGTKYVAMVKAFSYGSGSYEIASALQQQGVDYLAVAYIDEGIALRNRGIRMPIIILNSNPNDYGTMIDYRLEPEIYSFHTLRLFIERCRREHIRDYPIHIKLDTGMHRVGFMPAEAETLHDLLNKSPEVRTASVFSHLSCSDMPAEDAFTRHQIALFEESSRKIAPGALRHICNTAGIERFPEAHFEMVRIGLGLYGINPTGGKRLKSVSTLRSIILQIKEIPQGEFIGYCKRGVAEHPMRIATVSLGYADGLNRKLGNGNWQMRVNGHPAPTVGNICMDTCMIDITDIPASEGDSVTVFDSAEEVNRMAGIVGTIPYEITTSISGRIKRVYIKEKG